MISFFAKAKKRNLEQLAEKFSFSVEEINAIKTRFDLFAEWGRMSLSKFRKSMGLLGTSEAEFLCDRIFSLFLRKGLDYAEFQDFLGFLSVLMKGRMAEKAKVSFRFLDLEDKGYINYKDLETIIQNVCYLWGYLTGQKVAPKRQYIEEVCNHLNLDNTQSRIDFESYLSALQMQQSIFNWFDLFNQTEPSKSKQLPLQEIASTLEALSDQLSSIVTSLKQEQEPSQAGDKISSEIFGPVHFDIKPYPLFGDLEEEDLSLNSFSVDKSFTLQSEQPLSRLKECLKKSIESLEPLVEGGAPKPRFESRKDRTSTVFNRHSLSKSSIYIGHQNWNLILNMMIGIRKATKGLFLPDKLCALEESEYERKCVYELIHLRRDDFDPEIASLFYEYAPSIFHDIRVRSGIPTESYLRSIGPENLIGNLIMGNLSSLSEQTSCGKSGSFFYYTEDAKVMIKTITRADFHELREILRPLHRHLCDNPDSLVCRLLGLYKMKVEGMKLYILAMHNLFSLPFEVDLRYDIKGSTFSRTSRTPEWEKTIALKDLDLMEDKFDFDLTREDKKVLSHQLEKDVIFFKENNLIDYSLLVGIHYGPIPPQLKGKYTWQSASRMKTYSLGIIDILTNYNGKKVLEKGVKHLVFGKGVSCTDPVEYGDRFLAFVRQHVLQL